MRRGHIFVPCSKHPWRKPSLVAHTDWLLDPQQTSSSAKAKTLSNWNNQNDIAAAPLKLKLGEWWEQTALTSANKWECVSLRMSHWCAVSWINGTSPAECQQLLHLCQIAVQFLVMFGKIRCAKCDARIYDVALMNFKSCYINTMHTFWVISLLQGLQNLSRSQILEIFAATQCLDINFACFFLLK